MKKGKVIGLILLAVGVAGAAGYFFYWKPKHPFGTNDERSKSLAIDYLLAMGHSNRTSLEGFDAEYVLAWASAIKKGKTTFKVGNTTYSIYNGRADKV